MNKLEDEYIDLLFDQTLKVLEANKEKEAYDLKFHLSNQKRGSLSSYSGKKVEFDLDRPNSVGNLEEEITGP